MWKAKDKSLNFRQAGIFQTGSSAVSAQIFGTRWDTIGEDLYFFDNSFLGLNLAQALAQWRPLEFRAAVPSIYQDLSLVSGFRERKSVWNAATNQYPQNTGEAFIFEDKYPALLLTARQAKCQRRIPPPLLIPSRLR